jgi:hypothetical protein
VLLSQSPRFLPATLSFTGAFRFVVLIDVRLVNVNYLDPREFLPQLTNLLDTPTTIILFILFSMK